VSDDSADPPRACRLPGTGIDCCVGDGCFRFRLSRRRVSGWLNRQQQEIVAYLVGENRILRAQLGAIAAHPMTSDGGWQCEGSVWACWRDDFGRAEV
jgi:hypothetical protein